MNIITNFLCLSLLLFGATALGMDQFDEELFEAAQGGNLEMIERVVERLIGRRASVDARNWNGWTPLLVAAEAGHEDICRCLIANKAAVEASSHSRSTPLLLAARSGHEAVGRLLIENRALVNAKNSSRSTPLILAARADHEDMCKLLIANKALVDVRNSDGATSLEYAALHDHEDVCRLLIDVQLEQAIKDKAAVVTFLGIMKKRKSDLSRYMDYNIARMVDRIVWKIVRKKNRSVIEQLNQSPDHTKAKWLAYINQRMNSANK